MITEDDLIRSTILIVDDEESIRLTFQLFLNRAGYLSVYTAADVGQAMAIARDRDPDLVVSDIVLKGESGTELLRQLRAEGIDCPVVMITGFPNLQTAAEAVRQGAFDYLSKPVNKESLLHFTRQALKQRRLQKEKKELEARNERYRRYLQAVFRSVRDMLVTVDADMRIVEMNETAIKALREKTGQENFPRDLKELDDLFGLPCLHDALRVVESRKEVREHRVECHWADGRIKVMSLNAAPIEDETGAFHGVVLVARDVSIPETVTSCRVRFHGYVGISPAMQEVYSLIENVGKFDTTVLITGESGTGKELAAEALHAESFRCHAPLVKVDCASIPEELLESELFGHRKGAFTGADRHREGRIQQADGGTLFLDEIGDISPRMQLRLLRFLQEKTLYPVGGDQPVSVDARVIAATNADLKDKMRQGNFREDLYYRLRVIEIDLPPLRDRRQDIPLLARHFIEAFQKKLGHSVSAISDQALEALTTYHWPGNVREFKHVMERACVLCRGATIQLEHLPREIAHPDPARRDAATPGKEHDAARAPAASPPAEAAEPAVPRPNPALIHPSEPPEDPAEAILHALRLCGGNKSKAARMLGIERSTLYRRMRRLGISAQAARQG